MLGGGTSAGTNEIVDRDVRRSLCSTRNRCSCSTGPNTKHNEPPESALRSSYIWSPDSSRTRFERFVFVLLLLLLLLLSLSSSLSSSLSLLLQLRLLLRPLSLPISISFSLISVVGGRSPLPLVVVLWLLPLLL